jgi:tyrosinase
MLEVLSISFITNLDAADLYGSSFFADNDPKSGLGGWGDPSRDFEVPSGGLSKFHLSYPSAHTLRRNFTLRPFLNSNLPDFFPVPDLMANTSFTGAEVNKMIEGFEGDFKGFQRYFENFPVRICQLRFT